MRSSIQVKTDDVIKTLTDVSSNFVQMLGRAEETQVVRINVGLSSQMQNRFTDVCSTWCQTQSGT